MLVKIKLICTMLVKINNDQRLLYITQYKDNYYYYRKMANSKQWPKVMSSHHRSKPCGPCALCHKTQPRYNHFCTLTIGEQRFLRQHLHSDISSTSCICRSHTNEAKQHRSDPDYIPTWKQSGHRSHNSTDFKRMYPGCTITCNPLDERIGERIITASGETLATFAKELSVEGVVTLCETQCIERYITSSMRRMWSKTQG